jgi:hypothetical protein
MCINISLVKRLLFTRFLVANAAIIATQAFFYIVVHGFNKQNVLLDRRLEGGLMSIWIDRVTSTITPSVFHQSIHDQDHGLN